MIVSSPNCSPNGVRRDGRSTGPVRGLQRDALEHLDRIGELITLARGQTVYREGNEALSFFIVLQGKVKLSFLSRVPRRTRNIVVHFAGPGDFLGLSAVLGAAPHELTAEAMEFTVVKKVRRANFLALQRENVEVSVLAAQIMAREYNDLIAYVHQWAAAGLASGRLARMLLDWVQADGRGKAWTRQTIRHMTHFEIAEMVGSTRETVTRILNRFECEGLIARHGDSIQILDRTALELKVG